MLVGAKVTTFKAFLVTRDNGTVAGSLRQVDRSELPAGDVLVRIAYSSLNYKDGLAVTGKPGVIRTYPMVPGVDFAGVVEESSAPQFKPGDQVVITGCGTSETLWGGYAQFARISAEFIVPVPEAMTLKQAMAVGTAGFTAMQGVMALEQHGVKPSGREVVVTGAAGGVGSVAIAILAHLGYKVAASTGRMELHEYLGELGASAILDRATLAAPSKRSLDPERWAGGIDNVGGDTLVGLLRSTATDGSIVSCGLAGGATFTSTVFPFILRGVNLLGTNSVNIPSARRRQIWDRIARDLPMRLLDSMTQVEPLEKIRELAELILAGKIRGRTVIDVNA
jgi:acrylyl-CoA reductase (NADPH)